MLAWAEAVPRFEVTGLLPQVKSPTLVLHRRQFPLLDVEVARRLASGIPNARLALLEGESAAPWAGDEEAVASAIDQFLDEGEQTATAAEAPPVGTVHTILFTDMESSTTLRQRLGDAKAQELVRIHNTIVRDALKGHGGSEIKHTGDGIMASFPGASGALECAVAIQRGVAAHVEQHPQTPLRVYIGLNAGEPISEDSDLFGTSVDLARRICDHAEPGEILASNVVRELAAGKGFLFADRGQVALRGFEDPVRLYEVRWREEG
jgi:adenylate cyclase